MAHAVGRHQSVHGGTGNHLVVLREVPCRVLEVLLGAVPSDCVHDNDGSSESRWPEVGREVDDGWRLPRSEEDVAREVAVDDLIGQPHGS